MDDETSKEHRAVPAIPRQSTQDDLYSQQPQQQQTSHRGEEVFPIGDFPTDGDVQPLREEARVFPKQRESSQVRYETPQRFQKAAAASYDSGGDDIGTYQGRMPSSQAHPEFFTQGNHELARQQDFSQERQELPQRRQQELVYQGNDEMQQRQQDFQREAGTFQGRRTYSHGQQELSPVQMGGSRVQHEYSPRRQQEFAYQGDDEMPQRQRDFQREVGPFQGQRASSQGQQELVTRRNLELLPAQMGASRGEHENSQRRHQEFAYQGSNEMPQRQQDFQREEGAFQGQRVHSQGQQDLATQEQYEVPRRSQQELLYQGNDVFPQGQGQRDFSREEVGTQQARRESLQFRDVIGTPRNQGLPAQMGSYQAHEPSQRRQELNTQWKRPEVGKYQSQREFSQGQYEAPQNVHGPSPQGFGRYEGDQEVAQRQQEFQGRQMTQEPFRQDAETYQRNRSPLGRGDYSYDEGGDYGEYNEYPKQELDEDDIEQKHPPASLGARRLSAHHQQHAHAGFRHGVGPRPTNPDDSHNELVVAVLSPQLQPARALEDVVMEPSGALRIEAIVLNKPENSGRIEDDDNRRAFNSTHQPRTSHLEQAALTQHDNQRSQHPEASDHEKGAFVQRGDVKKVASYRASLPHAKAT
eukprot:TRINITY_DN12889_c0_g1_i1.p1 TRINITY_DN12889_c0_g1~~TRINITY_DN12889_c0_g1_i1.p1  ORF type:complete len:699 (-),score=97.73 TRINITY_DN12889_c0_g1_i1:97-2013(-)